jgi:RNA polymerase sigma factor (TIGR02999 family)
MAIRAFTASVESSSMTAPEPSPHEMTQLLAAWSDGDREALDKLLPLVERELHRLAHRYMSRERPGHTLQTTALVNEAYVRLVNRKGVHWQNRAHFFAIASRVMRRILLDDARCHGRTKRGGDALRIPVDAVAVATPEEADRIDVIAVDRALQELEQLDPKQARIVELRFFGGMTVEETAAVLGISPRTVKREWAVAKGWLYRAIAVGKTDAQ